MKIEPGERIAQSPESKTSLSGASPARRVVILIFDALSCTEVSRSASDDEALAELELSSVFFEQHFSQDTRTEGFPFRSFGDPAAFICFATALTGAGFTTGQVTIQLDSPEACPITEMDVENKPDRAIPGVLLSLRLPLSQLSAANFAHAADNDSVVQSMDDDFANSLDQILKSDLLWIDVQHPRALHARTLTHVITALRPLIQQSSGGITGSVAKPILVVTARRGGNREVQPPFAAGFAEDAVRVPLWIDSGDLECGRVQSLTGSFDLLASLEEIFPLRPTPLPAGETAASESASNDESASENARAASSPRQPSVNLFRLAEAPGYRDAGMNCDRRLELYTDSGVAIRSTQFLVCEPPDDLRGDFDGHSVPEGSSSLESDVRIYVKPEDYWNIHDQRVVYETAASEFIRELRIISPRLSEKT